MRSSLCRRHKVTVIAELLLSAGIESPLTYTLSIADSVTVPCAYYRL